MPPTVRFGDAFKVTAAPRSFTDMKTEKLAEFDTKEAGFVEKGVADDDWQLKSVRRDRDSFAGRSEAEQRESFERDNMFVAYYGANAIEAKGGFTIVQDSYAPQTPETAGDVPGKVVFLVNDGPDGNDAQLYNTLVSLSEIAAAGKANGQEPGRSLSARIATLTDALHQRLQKHAIELPKLPYRATR